MTKKALLNNIAAIKGIGPKALQKIENEIDNYEEKNRINLPYCSDFKIEFYNEFGYEGLEHAEKSGEVSTYGLAIDPHAGMKSIADMLNSYAGLTMNYDTYCGAVVTMEFSCINE